MSLYDFQNTEIPDLYLIRTRVFEDERGRFVKHFHKSSFIDNGLDVKFREFFYSTSSRGVLRGLHFQVPPHDHIKLVFVTAGVIQDVIVDIRKGSPTYGRYLSFDLSAENSHALYIPSGCAHGFLSLTDGSCVNYLQSTEHNPKADSGLLYRSLGIDWKLTDPLVSSRDSSFPPLDEFESPFTWQKDRSEEADDGR